MKYQYEDKYWSVRVSKSEKYEETLLKSAKHIAFPSLLRHKYLRTSAFKNIICTSLNWESP
ncbi:asl2553 [Nostoc sp. PCC 7120 = FACHB-418]|nr:asl2553 [Nostoc sp. PCC 7120 = FACHB-418]